MARVIDCDRVRSYWAVHWRVWNISRPAEVTMNSLLVSLGSGLVSGLLVSLLGLLFRSWWLKVVEPWYEDKLYQNIKIEGKWAVTGTYEDSGTEDFMIELFRVGHSVSGLAVCSSGVDKGQKFQITGILKNNVLLANWSNTDSHRIQSGTLCLSVEGDGDKLKGINCYLNTETGAICQTEQIWRRVAQVIPQSQAMLPSQSTAQIPPKPTSDGAPGG
jgi:hypothetical protein